MNRTQQKLKTKELVVLLLCLVKTNNFFFLGVYVGLMCILKVETYINLKNAILTWHV